MESIVERQQALTARLQSYKDIEELHHCFEFCSNRRLRHWIQRKRYALHKVYDNTSPNAVEDLKAEWKHYDDCMVEEKEDTEVGEEEDDDSDGDDSGNKDTTKKTSNNEKKTVTGIRLKDGTVLQADTYISMESYLDTFCRHWPTDQRPTSISSLADERPVL